MKGHTKQACSATFTGPLKQASKSFIKLSPDLPKLPSKYEI